MPSVQVKDFPQDLYDQLKAFAEENHRSMSQQLIVAAERMLQSGATLDAPRSSNDTDTREREARIAKRKRLFKRIDASIAKAKDKGSWHDTAPDAASILRQVREERDAHMGDVLGFDPEEASA